MRKDLKELSYEYRKEGVGMHVHVDFDRSAIDRLKLLPRRNEPYNRLQRGNIDSPRTDNTFELVPKHDRQNIQDRVFDTGAYRQQN